MTTPSHAQLVADLVARFPPGQGARRGDLSRSQARTLVAEYGPEAVERQLAWFDSLPADVLGRARSLVGILRSALREAWHFAPGEPGPLGESKARPSSPSPRSGPAQTLPANWLPDTPLGDPSRRGEANLVAGWYREPVLVSAGQCVPGGWVRPPEASAWWPRLHALPVGHPTLAAYPGERGQALRKAHVDDEELLPALPALPAPADGELEAAYVLRAVLAWWSETRHRYAECQVVPPAWAPWGRWLGCPADHPLWPALARLQPEPMPYPLRLALAEYRGPGSAPSTPSLLVGIRSATNDPVRAPLSGGSDVAPGMS